MTVVGDAMSPSYEPGDRIVVDLCDATPSPPGAFLLWDGMSSLIQRVEHIANSDPPRIRVSSDNPRYAAYECRLDQARIRGRIIGKWVKM